MNVSLLFTIACTALLAAACSAEVAAPTAPDDTPRADSNASSPTDDDTPETPATGDDEPTGDNAGQTPTLPEKPTPAEPGDAFTGAPAFSAKLGTSARAKPHTFANDNPAGKACFDCHGSIAPAFAFAGTIYANPQGTMPAAKVEVRLRDSSGKALSAWTDADGNFFFPLDPDGDLGDGVSAGIRNANGPKLMTSAVAIGDCNSCHKAGGTAGRLVPAKKK